MLISLCLPFNSFIKMFTHFQVRSIYKLNSLLFSFPNILSCRLCCSQTQRLRAVYWSAQMKGPPTRSTGWTFTSRACFSTRSRKTGSWRTVKIKRWAGILASGAGAQFSREGLQASHLYISPQRWLLLWEALWTLCQWETGKQRGSQFAVLNSVTVWKNIQNKIFSKTLWRGSC